MPVDKFGRMSDTKTKDTGVSLTYINNNYVRSDGETPLTGSLNMRGNTIYNVADPVNPQDVVTKVYVDNSKGSGVIGRKTGNGVSIKENLDFLGKQKIKNLPDPVDGKDGVNKDYVDQVAINHPFEFIDNKYQAKDDLDLKGNKIKNLCSPFEDGDAVTKGYIDTKSAAFLKVDQGKYEAKADIDMDKLYTVYNVKDPIDEEHITNKKYVDDVINLNSAFSKKKGGYEAKNDLYMRKNKILGLREPTQPGEAANKKYVDDVTKNLFIDENDNIAFGLNVDMEGNKIFGLPEPEQDSEAATKKYVDDLQTQHVDQKGNVKFGRNINLDNKRIFAMKEPKKDYEGANKKYVDETINRRIQEEKDTFLPQDPATKNYVDEAIRGIVGGDVLVSKEGVFIKENGHYRATAPLDIDNQKVENIPDPVDEKDAVNKKYVDDVAKSLTLEEALIRENGGYNIAEAYINMNYNNIRNVGLPKDEADAVPRSFVDNMIKAVEEKIKKRKQLITVHARYCGPLEEGEFPFKFGGGNTYEVCNDLMRDYKVKSLISGFVMPHSGRLKKIIGEGLSFIEPNTVVNEVINLLNEKQINELKTHFGREDFKNDLLEKIKTNIVFNEKINLDIPQHTGKTFFEIVKIEKNFNFSEKTKFLFFELTKDTLVFFPLITKFEWFEINVSDYSLSDDIKGVRAIMKILNTGEVEFKKEEKFNEGDVLNIRISDFKKNLFIEDNILDNVLKTTVLFLLGKLNFNFTFLIELDPLEDDD